MYFYTFLFLQLNQALELSLEKGIWDTKEEGDMQKEKFDATREAESWNLAKSEWKWQWPGEAWMRDV